MLMIVVAMKPNFTLRAYHRLSSRVLRDEEYIIEKRNRKQDRMDFIEPPEKYNIVKMYRDSVCMADDMQAPNNLSFRCYSTDTADLLQEVRDKLPYIRNHCRWVVYAADEEKEEWLKIGFIERNENRYSTITEKEKTPYFLAEYLQFPFLGDSFRLHPGTAGPVAPAVY